ncbi:MAG: 1-acyl-sn-glycerol-3-phosphate acyltransferase [Acidobacteria bacterium]|nr:1-acyl-sn-glycerol-3-phosphate acyltransferase [Acidobacteriota bacterium]
MKYERAPESGNEAISSRFFQVKECSLLGRVVWTLSYRVTLFVVTSIILFVLAILTIIFPPFKDQIVDTFARLWARACLWSADAKVSWEGWENVPEKPPYIIVFNHHSDFDIYALMAGLPRIYRAVMKKELMYYPFFGWIIYFFGFVPIDRKNTKNAIRSINRAAKMFDRYPYIMAITGTRIRTRDFMKHEMKKGPAVTAIQYGVPLLPVTIVHTDEIHVKGLGLINPGKTIELIVHPTIDSTRYTIDERDQLVQNIKEVLAKPLRERRLLDE